MVEPRGIVCVVMVELPNATNRIMLQPTYVREAVALVNKYAQDYCPSLNASMMRHMGPEDPLVAVFHRATEALQFAADLFLFLQQRTVQDQSVSVRGAVFADEAEPADGLYPDGLLERGFALVEQAQPQQVLVGQSLQGIVEGRLPENIGLSYLGTAHLNDLHRAQRLFQLIHPNLKSDFEKISEPPHNLPQGLTQFVGREKEIEDIMNRVYISRLVTLTGPGGIGKTRLALQVAESRLEDLSDGAWFIDLSSLRDGDLLIPTVCAVLKLPIQREGTELEALISAIQHREMMLIFDNCEHLIGAAAKLIKEITARCRNAQILATSRQALKIRGEAEVPITSLAMPPQGGSSEPTSIADSARLFISRAELANPNFDSSGAEEEAVFEICRSLQGFPLAIEMAAASARTRKASQILAELRLEGFKKLRKSERELHPRQRTMMNAIGWSYGMLTEPAQRLLQGLSVFAGQFDLAAATSVCSDEQVPQDQIPELLTELAHKSMLVRENPRSDSFRLLEPIRQFARERLLASGDTSLFKDRHAEHFFQVSLSLAERLRTQDQSKVISAFESSHDNFRVALGWVLESPQSDDRGWRFTLAISNLWHLRGYYLDGLTWALRALRVLEPKQLEGKAGLLNMCGVFTDALGDTAQALRYYESGLRAAESTPDLEGVKAKILENLGYSYRNLNEYQKGKKSMLLALEAMQRAGDSPDRVNMFRMNFGALLSEMGENDLAEENLLQAKAHFERTGNKLNLAYVLFSLGSMRMDEGQYVLATEILGQSLDLLFAVGDFRMLGFVLRDFAELAVKQGLNHKAAALLGGEHALRNRVSIPIADSKRASYEGTVEAAETALGKSKFDFEWNRGAEMSVEELVQLAKGVELYDLDGLESEGF